MMNFLETLKDSAESGFDSATSRVENIHRLIGGYVRQHVPGSGSNDEQEQTRPSTVYDVIRGVNREIGAFGTDLFEIVDDARMRRASESGHHGNDDD